MRYCSICCREMDDERHVSVECFYAVEEIVPEVKQETVFVEVASDGIFLGDIRRYDAGVKEQKRLVQVDEKSSKLEIDEVSIPAIRLLEKTIYTKRCCKRCRSEFLTMMKRWVQGEFIEVDDPNANIPVRINGTTKMMTQSQYSEWKKKQV